MKQLLLVLCLAMLAACGSRSEWQDLVVPEGGFAVLMRGQPEYVRQQLDTPAGKMSAHLYSADRPDAYYAVGYSDYPLALVLAASPDQIFAGARDTWVKRIQGKLSGSSPLKLAGKYPGLRFTAEGTFKDKETFVDGRLYLVDQRLYQVIVMGRKSELSQGVVNRFLDSFQLIPITETQNVPLKPQPAK